MQQAMISALTDLDVALVGVANAYRRWVKTYQDAARETFLSDGKVSIQSLADVIGPPRLHPVLVQRLRHLGLGELLDRGHTTGEVDAHWVARFTAAIEHTLPEETES